MYMIWRFRISYLAAVDLVLLSKAMSSIDELVWFSSL